MKLDDCLISLCKIDLSLLPEVRTWLFQARHPTRAVCPFSKFTYLSLLVSQIYTSPTFVPIAKYYPLNDQLTEVTESEIPRSQSLVTLEFCALHRYTHEERPTAKIFS